VSPTARQWAPVALPPKKQTGTHKVPVLQPARLFFSKDVELLVVGSTSGF
jgi:hypothetical protein